MAWLHRSRLLWKRRHAYRSRRLALWRRREAHRYRRWVRHSKSRPEGHPLRVKWYRLFEEADAQVDKWTGLRDEAAAQLKRRRSQITGQASAHFRVGEFDCRDGTAVPRQAIPALRTLAGSYLERLRGEFGPAVVLSGYRHRAYNASIGGAAQSRHIYDEYPREVAADVRFERGNPEQWARFARALPGVGGVGQYDRAGFVHVDLGPRRDWSG